MRSKPQGFTRAEHLRSPLDFRRVYERRRSASDAWLIVYACENGLSHLRLGMSVSRKIGKATHRNRLRRLYREAFRLSKAEMPRGLDLVLIPRTTEEPSLVALRQSVPRLVNLLAERLAREAQES
jgi:ribonuclease P protein component